MSQIYRQISTNLFNNDISSFHTRYDESDEIIREPETQQEADISPLSQEEQNERNIEKLILGLDKNSINNFKNQSIDIELESKLLEVFGLRPNGRLTNNKEQVINSMYLNSMKRTFFDKCFFISFLPRDQRNILLVDFGCADGSFCSYIKQLLPDNTDMVGIENNTNYMSEASKNKDLKAVYKNVINFDEEFDKTDYDYIHLNFSSVFHEIASEVQNPTDLIEYIIRKVNPNSISIRDMSLSTIDDKFTNKITERTISNSVSTTTIVNMLNLQRSNSYFKFNCLMFDIFQKSNFKDKFMLYTTLYKNFQVGTIPFTFEFLMKYFYDINPFHNEFKENYFNVNMDIDNILSNLAIQDRYSISHCRKYTPSFLKNKWIADFRESSKFSSVFDSITTHYDLFLTKDPERRNNIPRN